MITGEVEKILQQGLKIIFSLELEHFLTLKWRKIEALKYYYTRVQGNQLQLSSPSQEKKLWLREVLTSSHS